MNPPLVLFARIRPKPEHYDTCRRALLEVVPLTRAEPGCRAFALHEAEPADGTLYLYEVFDDQAALDAHLAAPYMQPLFEGFGTWLEAPVDGVKTRPLEA